MNGDSPFQARRASAGTAAGESDCPRGPIKRSVMIAGHATSISLEPIFWDALREAAAEERLPLNALVARIDAERVDAPEPVNLGSTIRVWLFQRAIAKRLQ